MNNTFLPLTTILIHFSIFSQQYYITPYYSTTYKLFPRENNIFIFMLKYC